MSALTMLYDLYGSTFCTDTCSVAVLMAESTVLYEYYEDLTVNLRTTGARRTRHRVSQAYSLSQDFDVFFWLVKQIQNTH